MAKVTDIRKCSRLIRVTNRTVMDVNADERYFSMWVYAAGQESGAELCPLNIQIDKSMANKLIGYLKEFVND